MFSEVSIFALSLFTPTFRFQNSPFSKVSIFKVISFEKLFFFRVEQCEKGGNGYFESELL